MKKTIIFLAMFACGTATFATETTSVVKIGDSVALHREDSSSLRRYGDGKPVMKWPTSLARQYMMWKIGDGVLVLEYGIGLGRITELTYVVRDSKGKTVTSFPVKEFNPTTREMTIMVPNKILDPIAEPARSAAPPKGQN